MKNSVLNSLLLLLFLLASCSPSILKGFHKTGTTTVSRSALYPFFGEADNIHYFNMQIDFRKNHFSGLLIIKQTEENTYRLALNSYFGMGIFDFEFTPDTFTVHHCLEVLNKKRVISTLENDFRKLLFLNIPAVNEAQIYEVYDSPRKVYRIKSAKDKQYYLVDDSLQELQKMEIPHFFSGLRYEFSSYSQHFPVEISIRHTNIGLKLQLDKINK